MSRESLNKLLNRWIDEGVVFQEKGVLTICNPDLLEELAEASEWSSRRSGPKRALARMRNFCRSDFGRNFLRQYP